jgi:glycosyltransferase involved in cell wall biosynthesis
LEKVDALGIVDTVLELRRDKALSDRLASGALRFASQNFNWERNTGALAAFYEQIAANRPKESRHVSTVASS